MSIHAREEVDTVKFSTREGLPESNTRHVAAVGDGWQSETKEVGVRGDRNIAESIGEQTSGVAATTPLLGRSVPALAKGGGATPGMARSMDGPGKKPGTRTRRTKHMIWRDKMWKKFQPRVATESSVSDAVEVRTIGYYKPD